MLKIIMDDKKKELYGLIISAFVGAVGYGVHVLVKSTLAEPLVISLLLGIIIRAILPDIGILKKGLSLPVRVFIPIGLVFYSAHHLNLSIITEVQTRFMILLLIVMLAYFISIILMGRFLKQKKEITYLIANGSAICGASAIVITSSAIDSEPEDVSISLLSVTIVAMAGVFIIFPFITTISGMKDITYAIFSGALIQLTGLIKIALGYISYMERVTPYWQLIPLAFSIKAVKYLGLFFSIPIFTTIIRKRFSIPYVLWIFLVFGIIGTLAYKYNEQFYENIISHVIRPIHQVSWSIVLGAIGLNAEIGRLFSDNGIKALAMAFTGFFVAIVAFFIGSYILI